MQPQGPSSEERPAVLSTQGLSRRFAATLVVDRLSLSVPQGSFFGFLGPNGAGKSTTMKMLTGLLAPSAGSVEIFGLSLEDHPLEIRRRIGVMPEDLALFDRLTGLEFLHFVGRMYELDIPTLTQRRDALLEALELDAGARTLITDYSQGMKKKIALAAALLHAPEMLFLDEPFEGLDALTSRTLKNLLTRAVQSGMTVFLTSHILEIVERLCTHVAVIHRGRIQAQGPMNAVRRDQDGGFISLEDAFLQLVGGPRPDAEGLDWLFRTGDA